MKTTKKTKIVATVGPATASKKMLEAIIAEGVNVIRINFSHGEHKDHVEVIKRVRQINKEQQIHTALLGDLQGPKIRVGKIKEGMPLILRIGAIEGETFDAILEYISPKGVEEEGAIQFEIKAAVKLKDNQFIRAGYSANADIVLDKRVNVLALSEALLQFDGDSAYVELEVGEQEYEKRYIKTGLSDGINIEILEGVKKEDQLKLWNLSEPIKKND